MARASFRLTVINDTGYEIFLRTGASDYITFDDGSPAKLGTTTPMAVGAALDLVFWIGGGHGTGPAWLALGAYYVPVEGLNAGEYDDFVLNTRDYPPSYLRRHVNKAAYATDFTYMGEDDNRAHNVLTFRDAARWPADRPRAAPVAPSRADAWSPDRGPPLELKYVSEFDLFWSDAGSGAIFDTSVWAPRAPGGWHVLGHIADGPVKNGPCETDKAGVPVNPGGRVALVARATGTGVLAPPVDYEWIGSDKGSGATADGSWWRPVPPPGFKALGTFFFPYYVRPPLSAMMCVCDALVVPGKGGQFRYADRGSEADEDVSIFDIVPSSGDPGINIGAAVAMCGQARGAPPKWEYGPLHVLAAGSMTERMVRAGHAPWQDLAQAPPAPRLTYEEVIDLARKHGPILHLHPDEVYMPMSVLEFETKVRLVEGPEPHAVLTDDTAKLGNLSQAKAYVFSRTINEVFTDLQFWFFYGMNGETFVRARVYVDEHVPLLDADGHLPDITRDNLNSGSHVGDWEHVTLRFETATRKLAAVCYSAHGDRRWYAPVYEPDGEHVKVYSALHMHGTYRKPGDHLELASWSTLNCGVATVEPKVFSSNRCADGGKVMDASTMFEIVEHDGAPNLEQYWARQYRGWRWGPKMHNKDVLHLCEVLGHSIDIPLYEGDDNGPGTPEFLHD